MKLGADRLNDKFWRNLTNFWTVVFFVSIVYDFLKDNILDHHGVILIISVLYGASLAVYSAEKEFKRWHDKHQTIHPGELYVILWTILVFGILIINIYFHKPYELPAEVRATYIVVIGILALTKESKYLYGKERRRRQR